MRNQEDKKNSKHRQYKTRARTDMEIYDRMTVMNSVSGEKAFYRKLKIPLQYFMPLLMAHEGVLVMFLNNSHL